MIEVEHLTKFYGPVPAIQDMSFSVERGEILGVLGPNGAGKTTTMRIITCFLPATRGRVRVAGYDVFTDPMEVRRRVGYLPESVPLYKEAPVSSFLNFVGEVKGLSRAERRRQIGLVMEECGIESVQHRIIGRLSKGYQQRVGLAQALLGNPEVLILDEPTTGLDPKQIIEIRELIRQLGTERTVILCTHILPEVSMICQRVLIINDGHLVADGTPESLRHQVQRESRIAMSVEGPSPQVLQTLQSVPGVLSVLEQQPAADGVGSYVVKTQNTSDLRKNLSSAVFQAGWGLLELRPLEVSLEDVFVKLVTEEGER